MAHDQSITSPSKTKEKQKQKQRRRTNKDKMAHDQSITSPSKEEKEKQNSRKRKHKEEEEKQKPKQWKKANKKVKHCKKEEEKKEEEEEEKDDGDEEEEKDDGDEEVEEKEEEEKDNGNEFDSGNCSVSKILSDTLLSKNVKSLDPIQRVAFDDILNGFDLVATARSGQGTAEAYVLPILQSLLPCTGGARYPTVLVLVATQKLVYQVSANFDMYGLLHGLNTCKVYIGRNNDDQAGELDDQQVDIVIGTPGRVRALINSQKLNICSLKFCVLDQADDMHGVSSDVEHVLGEVDISKTVQWLIFAATPNLFENVTSRYLNIEKTKIIDLQKEMMKIGINDEDAIARHIAIPCSIEARETVIPDIIRCYGRGGHVILHTMDKDSASSLSDSLVGAFALNGDDKDCELIAAFRSRKFMTLVTYDDLDIINGVNVQLIILCGHPGKKYFEHSERVYAGDLVMLYDSSQHHISTIESEARMEFDQRSAAQATDIADSIAPEIGQAILEVSESVVPGFMNKAESLIKDSGFDAVNLLSKALAKASGFTEIRSRSLRNSNDDYVTVQLDAPQIEFDSPVSVRSYLEDSSLTSEQTSAVRNLILTHDHKGAVFDVRSVDKDAFISLGGVNVLSKLPTLADEHVLNLCSAPTARSKNKNLLNRKLKFV